MKKFLWMKVLGTLAVIGVIGAYTYYNLNKFSTDEHPVVITKQVAKGNLDGTPQEQISPKQTPIANHTVENHLDKTQDMEHSEEKSRFGQSGDFVLEAFKSEPVLDASWTYTQEQLIHNIITQEIYPNEGIKTAHKAKVKCKSETCLLTTKLESFQQVQEFYNALIKYGSEKGYEFTPVKMSPEETIFALYPPKS